MSPTQALMRFLSAAVSLLCAGLGFLWMLFSKNKTTWHDQFSDTVVVYVPSDKEISQLENAAGSSTRDTDSSDTADKSSGGKKKKGKRKKK